MGSNRIEITGVAQKQAWIDKVLPPIEEVRPGLFSIPVIFPENPMRYTLCYALINDQQCIIIDPGFDSDEGQAQIAAALRRADIGMSEITGIIATHFHHDHLGMAARLAKASGAWIALGEDERRYITDFTDAEAEVQADRERMGVWGVPYDRRAEGAMSIEGLMLMKNLADPDLRLQDDQILDVAGRKLRIAATPGHTPGHICLWNDSESLVLAGDHVLPRISPNVSLEIRGDTDPLRKNIESLRRIAQKNHYEVAPAHEYRFRGVADRADDLREHIQSRSDEVLRVLEAGAPSVHEVARKLTWSRGWDSLGRLQFRLALSETAAHIQYLVTSGIHQGVPGLPGAHAKI